MLPEAREQAGDVRHHQPFDPIEAVLALLLAAGRCQPASEAGRAARTRVLHVDDHRLGEQLPNDSESSRADRGANGELALAARRARQHQIGDVGGGDEKNERHRAHHRRDDELHVSSEKILA